MIFKILLFSKNVHASCYYLYCQTDIDFISVILTEIKFQTGMRFSCEQYLTEAKWISAASSYITFNTHMCSKLIAGSLRSFWQKWNFISGDKISCKLYPKWNAYACPSKYWVVFKCSLLKCHMNRTCFHASLNLKTVWAHFASHVNVLPHAFFTSNASVFPLSHSVAQLFHELSFKRCLGVA